ncbi:hypothetical protein [Undibacterium sp.]|uniref:hypothetical protein n=1 Tax=Undibacterium sp. TaxID=1914977 RepID=UPI0037500C0E
MLKIVTLGFFLFSSQAALACSCSKPQVPETVRNYAHIFEGQVVSIAFTNRNDGKYAPFVVATVEFNVRKMIAGSPAETIKVQFGGSTSCDLEEPQFMVGQTWLISDKHVYLERENHGIADYKKWKPSGTFHANYCSLRKLITSETK